jgi:hypothetical protein
LRAIAAASTQKALVSVRLVLSRWQTDFIWSSTSPQQWSGCSRNEAANSYCRPLPSPKRWQPEQARRVRATNKNHLPRPRPNNNSGGNGGWPGTTK